MPKLDAEDLLAAWQVLWGQLHPEWHSIFLGDPLVAQIIWYDSEYVYPSLKKFRKLSEVLQDIRQGTTLEVVPSKTQIREEYFEFLSEKERRLKKLDRPKETKPNPSEMPPLVLEGNAPWGDWWRES